MGTAMPALAPGLAWLVWRAALDDDAIAAVHAAAPASLTDGAALVAALQQAERGADALRVIACALPPREGVWWGYVAAQHASQLVLDPPVAPGAAAAAALAAVERWMTQPDDDTRRNAWASSDAATLETAAGSVAAAVYFTGGSIAPAGVATIPPPAGLHCTLAGAGVLLAAASDPAHFAPLVDAYVTQGLEMIRQLEGWDASIAQARAHYVVQADLHAAATGIATPSAPPAE